MNCGRIPKTASGPLHVSRIWVTPTIRPGQDISQTRSLSLALSTRQGRPGSVQSRPPRARARTCSPRVSDFTPLLEFSPRGSAVLERCSPGQTRYEGGLEAYRNGNKTFSTLHPFIYELSLSLSFFLSFGVSLSLSLSLQGLEETAVQLSPPRANAHPRFTGFVRIPLWGSPIEAQLYRKEWAVRVPRFITTG